MIVGRQVVFGALAGLMLLNIAVANASFVEWRLHDVVFDDDGIATGFLIYDTQSVPQPGSTMAAPLDFDITVTGGTVFSPFDYTKAVATPLTSGDPSCCLVRAATQITCVWLF